jgi:segregation and condensation protein A
MDFLEEELDFELAALAGLPRNLEQHIRRRLTSPPPQARPVTLQDLIQQLESIANKIAEPASRPRPVRGKPMSVSAATKTIAELAHDENLTEMATLVADFLVNYTSESEQWNLDDLVALWSSKFPCAPGQVHSSPNHDRVGVFWALLLLASQSKVELSQAEFYQTLTIQRIDEDLPAHEFN